MNNIKLSIVVPCYNSSDFISECIQSILPHLTNSIELIIVNDGSTDSSYEIITNIVQSYCNINVEIINQRNLGLSAARNKGIAAASGEYISFLDSDDFYHSDFWSEISPVIDDSTIDIVEFNAEQYEGDISNIVEHIDSAAFSGKTEITAIEKLTPAFKRCKWYPWARVYKTSLFRENNITFPHGRLYEDMNTIPFIYLKSSAIYGINKSLLWYRHHKKSITQTFRQKDLSDLVYAAQSLSLLAKDNPAIKRTLFPTIQRIFNFIKYTIIRNKGAKLTNQEQKTLRRALLIFINYFRVSRKAQILMLPLYLNTVVRFRKK
ncbi:glycosyltransferase [Kosakonia sp. MUSA4]|uniref:glycosyltransferase family 2 protein n=1 Tax=Kosakonia sp. MUSA4 TaxID=2067958 RepID=UPI00209823C2|nr:glycosyltransferase [Kosakonia sp. MUSA4]